MKQQDYNATITVGATAHEAFEHISHVWEWWTENFEGSAHDPGDIFTVRFGETFVTCKITEAVPDRKIVWLVTDCYLGWLADKKEWQDTKIDWEITGANILTEVSMTHIGLVPAVECYDSCVKGWNEYVKDSLFKLITSGKGQPQRKAQQAETN